jgi:hypothetical protein
MLWVEPLSLGAILMGVRRSSRLHWRRLVLCIAILSTVACGVARGETRDTSLPHLEQKDGRYALVVDGAPYLILGAQVNNSSAWPAMLPKVWPAMEALHVNTVEIPVYWEQLEPKQGEFDYTVVDTLLTQAREHHLH